MDSVPVRTTSAMTTSYYDVDDEHTAEHLESVHLIENLPSVPMSSLPGFIGGESTNEIESRLSNEFVPIMETDADTLLYIGPPPQEPNQDDQDYEHIKQHYRRPYLMRSDTIKRINSSRFDTFLGPMSARAERRLKKLGVHREVQDITNIKYYIDLRPMLNDDAAELLSQLTVPKSALAWCNLSKDFSVPRSVVSGNDQLNVPRKPKRSLYANQESEEIKPQQLKQQSTETASAALQDEYSRLRHHSAIERLLHAMLGHDVKLNSAAKVWTFCAIANYFDCARHSLVNDSIVTWIVTGSNRNFVQSCPDVVYRMAIQMQHSALTRCTFAMLVGQKAFANAKSESTQAPSPVTSGRKPPFLESLNNDDEVNRIDHAANSFYHRVHEAFLNLVSLDLRVGDNGKRLHEKIDWMRPELDEAKMELAERLQNFLRRKILQVLARNRHQSTSETGEQTLVASSSLLAVYNSTEYLARLLTPFFWVELRYERLTAQNSSLANRQAWRDILTSLQRAGILPEHEQIPFVDKQEVYQSFAVLNNLISNQLTEPSPRLGIVSPSNTTSNDGTIPFTASLPLRALDPTSSTRQASTGPTAQSWISTGEPVKQELQPDLVRFDSRPEDAIPAHHETHATDLHTDFYRQPLLQHPNDDRNLLSPGMTIQKAQEHIGSIASDLLRPGYVTDGSCLYDIPITQISTLISLTEAEWKYLPLWAGGLDDGTGGVFNDGEEIPDAPEVEFGGFGGGPGRGLRSEAADSAFGDDSEYDVVSLHDAATTVGRASRLATDGSRTIPASVISMDE